MSEFLLGFTLLAAGPDLALHAYDERILAACVHELAPWSQWREGVEKELAKLRKQHGGTIPNECQVSDWLLGPGYDDLVSDTIKIHLRNQWWPPKQLWLASRGKEGEAPTAGQRVVLRELVIDIGKSLPGAVRRRVEMR